ncbi:MAG: methylated-DNA--[protein]-cysteine S-methyltransferase [Dehalococcoidales bacterium]|nr:methylated-DNA--[protein]-cysteine S-methyltransferase [Dehalococcoidales bacterium]
METTVLSPQSRNKNWLLAYSILNTSRGWVGVMASPFGIRKLALPRETPEQALFALGNLNGATIDECHFASLEKKLQAYFNGEKVTFDEITDLAEYSPFMQSVWRVTRQVGYGQTASYRDIASKTVSPRSFRAVGTALKHNPVPIIVPCHRIIGADGRIGGFNGGVALKKELLLLEQKGLSGVEC